MDLCMGGRCPGRGGHVSLMPAWGRGPASPQFSRGPREPRACWSSRLAGRPDCRPSGGARSLVGGRVGLAPVWTMPLSLGVQLLGGGAPLSSGQNSPSGVTSQGTCAGDSGTCRGLDGRQVGREERAPGGGRRSPRAVREGPSVQAEAAHTATRDRPHEPQWWQSCGRRARPGAAKTDDGGTGDTPARRHQQ